MQELYPEIEVTSNYEDIINDPDIKAVAIATPVNTHYPLAKACLNSGKHTFIEKPLASTTLECEELIDLANKNSLSLMVGHVFIYSPPVIKIKEIIDSYPAIIFSKIAFNPSSLSTAGTSQFTARITMILNEPRTS